VIEVISRRAHSVNPEAAQGRQSLRVVPIVGPSQAHPPYELLRQATLAKVQVSEISDSGSVPELRVQNSLDVRVFLMDGQELVGAKQNRVLNTDVMVPANASVIIPVSCVEQGRWRPVSTHFSPGKSESHRTRLAKAARVYESLKAIKKHDANQAAVWAEVEASLAGSGTSSPTHALSDAYLKRDAELKAFRETLVMPPEAVGVAVLHGSKLQGLDLFDRHTTLRYFWESLLDSYAIDFLMAPLDPAASPPSAEAEQIRQALDRAAGGTWEDFASPGEGRDWRLADDQLSGAALVCEESVVHLQLFPKPATSEPAMPAYRPRIRRPYGA
jgi:hypothetical protein